MEIKYQVVVKDGKAIEEMLFEHICCEDMKKALLSQEISFTGKSLWIYCPFCKKEIVY